MNQKITIIDGNPENGSADLRFFLENFVTEYQNGRVNHIRLSEEELRYCTGCWDCWWKTPGVCKHRDSMDRILPIIMNSDLVVFCSPVIMGFYSALLKQIHDRMIPLVHPYIEMVNKEMHHKKRYPVYPLFGVIIDPADATEKELDVIRLIFNRLALNLKTEIRFFYPIDRITVTELKNELSHLR